MSFLLTREQVVQQWQGKPGLLREQHCMACEQVLAIEHTDKFGNTDAGAFYVVKDCLWLGHPKEPHLLYVKERWYGNPVRCPVCGRQGKLPMDKPYSCELIEKSKEERNVTQN